MDQGGWLWFAIDVIFVAILAAVLIYGLAMWRRRYRDPATEAVRDEATDRLYHKRES